jgi:cytochrome c553
MKIPPSTAPEKRYANRLWTPGVQAISRCIVILLGALSSGTGCHDIERSRQIDNPAVAGRTIALQVCSNCHSVNGVSASPTFPKLAGQRKEYLVNQLVDFRAHVRSDPNGKRFMWGFSHLSDTQIDQLATYFSSRPPPAGVPGDRPLVDNGRAIFVSGIPDRGVPACSACHGAHGEGMGEIPRLAGQHADYILKQLLVFRHAGLRPRGESMKVISGNLSNQDMRSVAAFLEASSSPAEIPANLESTIPESARK